MYVVFYYVGIYRLTLIVCGAVTQNVQCYYNNVEKTWVVDNSEVAAGLGGQDAINCFTRQFISRMQANSGCGTK